MDEIKKLEIFYIRHADTSGSARAGACGCDIDISPLGEEQAKLLAERFRGASFDAVLCSPLVRAVKTAAALSLSLSSRPVIEIVPELIEKGTMPGYTGADIAFLKKYYTDLVLCPDEIYGRDGVFSNMTDEENTERAKAVIKYLRKRFHYDQRIAVVSHGSFGNSFLPAAVDMDEGDFILSINNTSVSKIKYTSDGKQRLSFVNDISHLRPLMPDYEFSV